MFADETAEQANDALPNVPDWDEHTRLAAEKEILGFFITGHPMEKYKEKLADLNALSTEEIAAMKKSTAKDENITTAGLISGLRVAKSNEEESCGRRRRWKTCHGKVELLVFPEAYRKLAEKVKLEVPVLIRGGVRIEEGANPK